MLALQKALSAWKSKRAESAQRVGSEYDALVRNILAGNVPDADEMDRVCREAGKTEEDLQTDVNHHVRRRDARKRLDEAAAMEKKLQKLREEHNAKLNALAMLKAKPEAELAKLLEEINKLLGEKDKAIVARNELLASAPPALRQKAADLRQQINDAGTERNRQEKHATDAASALESMDFNARQQKQNPDRYKNAPGVYVGDIDKVHAHHEQIAKTARKSMTEIDKTVAGLKAELEKVESQMLEVN